MNDPLRISITLNGTLQDISVNPTATLSEVLRDECHLTGTKTGCDTGTCGSCTVLVDGRPNLSCLLLAADADGRVIETVEHAASDPLGAALGRELTQCNGSQCGICTPGFVMTGLALLRANALPTRDDIDRAIAGNLCRCTGYEAIRDAILRASGQAGRVEYADGLVRVDGLDQATGRALYIDDLSLPGMLVGRLLRSPHAHARITSIDVSALHGMNGVFGVVTGEDLPTPFGLSPWSVDETTFASEKVLYVGHPVAAVAAADAATAERACAAVKVEYEVLPHYLTPDMALATKPQHGVPDDVGIIHPVGYSLKERETREHPRSFGDALHPNVFKQVTLPDFGDVNAAFERAAAVARGTFTFTESAHVPLETQGVLATWALGRLEIVTSTQVKGKVRKIVARVLGLEQDRVRVRRLHVGAGYGQKSEVFPHEIAASALAILTCRPVKMIQTREEMFLNHRGRHAMTSDVSLALDAEGNIAGVMVDAVLNCGAGGSFKFVTPYYALQLLGIPLRFGSFRGRATSVYTNTPPKGPMRGHGTVQVRFAIETLLDEAAEQLGLDPIEVRRRNAMQGGEKSVNGFLVPSCSIREGLETIERLARPVWEAEYKGRRGYGFGVATSAYLGGGTAYAPDPEDWDHPQSSARLEVLPGRRLRLTVGDDEIGQGSDTAAVKAAARGADLPESLFDMESTDSDAEVYGEGSYSSRVTFMMGTAAFNAGAALRRRLAEVGDLDALVGEVFTGAYETIPVTADGQYRGNTIGASPTYSDTATAAIVHVDEETGVVTPVRLWVAYGAGNVLNPNAARGQIVGSAWMGMCEALTEEVAYDPGTGLPKAQNLLGYPIRTSVDSPQIDVTFVGGPDPMSPLGTREVGQGGLHGAIYAIANAIRDATGAPMRIAPFTPPRVLAAMRERKGGG